jgi:hypothetical protein
VGRTNGSGKSGTLIGLDIGTNTPKLIVRDPGKGCNVFEPPTLGTVNKGQTRIMQRAADQSLCPS